ncbi:hypothetical protein PHLGIDRAFT_263671 [Phlebiopsis gigantea 11061_1 CR5-6]|uniref:Uncharacterized protein n=1 Tax=Phlebiopsis gigantea (strain 11061_1 CR5-6) TaxID=745531 RepID=A0A0C3PX28_PHLG1|nr:hypothetical protein PHLGIDRAFT_263671 [Phlebiopsis gigantea 11061_1 CR5-6]
MPFLRCSSPRPGPRGAHPPAYGVQSARCLLCDPSHTLEFSRRADCRRYFARRFRRMKHACTRDRCRPSGPVRSAMRSPARTIETSQGGPRASPCSCDSIGRGGSPVAQLTPREERAARRGRSGRSARAGHGIGGGGRANGACAWPLSLALRGELPGFPFLWRRAGGCRVSCVE